MPETRNLIYLRGSEEPGMARFNRAAFGCIDEARPAQVTARWATNHPLPKPSCRALQVCPTLRSGQPSRATTTAGL